MNVTLRSDRLPDVLVATRNANGDLSTEVCDLEKLDRHIRALVVARTWLKREKQRTGAVPK
jgi:hypothetical protein